MNYINNNKNKNDLLSWMQKFKKIDYKCYENKKFEMSQYFKTLKIEDSRVMLRYRLKMIQTIRSNFKSNKKYKSDNYRCPDCTSLGIPQKTDTQEHVLTSDCQANMDLKINRDFSKDEDICGFFKDLVKRRVDRYGC